MRMQLRLLGCAISIALGRHAWYTVGLLELKSALFHGKNRREKTVQSIVRSNAGSAAGNSRKIKFVKGEDCGKKKSKAKSMEPRPSPFSDLKPKTQLYLCNLGAKIPVHCLFINSRTQKRKKRKRKRRITGN